MKGRKSIFKWRGPGLGFEDITEKRRKVPESKAPAVYGDIEPYEFMGESHKGNHEIITSRTRHKEVLKEGGYIEVGNEKPKELRG